MNDLKQVYSILVMQVITILLIATAFCIMHDKKAMFSVISAGITVLLPELVFIKKLFQYQGAQAFRKIVNNFYMAEFLKIICVIILFALIFKYIPINPLIFFVTYIIVIMHYCLAPLILSGLKNMFGK